MSYPGGKGNCYQRIINLIPPHKTYIETHAGSAAVGLNKRPAELNFFIDIDSDVCRNLADPIANYTDDGQRAFIVNCDAVTWLKEHPFTGDEFIYCDPPYVMSSRRQQRRLYRWEYTKAQHVELLKLLLSLPCDVMISGYKSSLYLSMLQRWNVVTFEAMTRGNSWATEYLWMNYPEPERLHDYQYLGEDFRERERIKRKAARWVNRFQSLPLLERQAILRAMDEAGLVGPYRQK